jgi:cytochrome c-type biogenesis protein CcmH
VPADAPDPRSGRRVLRRSWRPWIPLALVLGLALAVGAVGSTGPATNEERVTAIARTIKCPSCQGESVADSSAPVSQTIRVEIAQGVEQGQTDDQIRQRYVDTYGKAVLLIPTGSGIGGLVWVLPVVALVAALAGLFVAFRRWGEQAPVAATDADRALVQAAFDNDRETTEP